MEKDKFMQMAIDQAMKSRGEGGIPIGSVLVTTNGCKKRTRFCTAKWIV
jgi:tRNA(Arg) A34 adenosine deaminase TadA